MPDFKALLAGGGDMASRIRAHDWSATPLGPPSGWPEALWSSLSICLHSPIPTSLYWGRDLRIFFNDAWLTIFGGGRVEALGRSAREAWPDIWHILSPQFEDVIRERRGLALVEQQLPMMIDGQARETYLTYSSTPVALKDGTIAGIINQGHDVTGEVLRRRRDALILTFNERARPLDDVPSIVGVACTLLGEALQVDRVGFGEIQDGHVQIMPCWTNGTLPDVPGRWNISRFGEQVRFEEHSNGSFAVSDAHSDARLNDEARAGYDRTGIRANILQLVSRQGHSQAVLLAHSRQPRTWTDFERQMVTAVAESLWQELGRARAATALKDREQRFRLIVEQANDLIFTADLDQRITSCNAASAALLGTTPDQLIGRPLSDFLSPDDFRRSSEMLANKIASGGTTRYEVEVNLAQDRTIRLEVNSTLQIDEDGRAIGLQAIARDITERHQFEERRTLLIHELNHRVKNTLALVQGLALQSFRGDVDKQAAQQIFQARLETLAAAHDLLSRERWEGATLGQLVEDATRPHLGSGERIAHGGPHVLLNPKAAISLVLALHELGTNAAKYGSLSASSGRVSIDWSIADGRLALEWREEGGPPVAPPTRRGFGLRMIERTLAADLEGIVDFRFEDGGLVCRIDAPVPMAAAA